MIDKFITAMSQAGCTPYSDADVIETGGESRLIRAEGDKAGRKSLYYSWDGTFGNWYSCKTGENGYWYDKGSKSLSKEERAALKQERENRLKELEQAHIRQQSELAIQLESEWDFYSENGSSAYLDKKRISNFGGRFDPKKLILKIVDRDWKIWGLQDIYPDGLKLFRKGARKKGCFIPIGIESNDNPERVYFVEGYATGVSVHMAMGDPVIACLDAGNMPTVAVSLRSKWIDTKFIFCADNDKFDKDGNLRDENPGRKAAEQAAAKARGFVIWPEFPDDDKKNKDFNDLHVLSGLDSVRQRLELAGSLPLSSEPAAQDGPPVDHDYIDTSPVYHDDGGAPLFVIDDNDVIGSEVAGDLGLPIRVLGYDNKDEIYYYYSFLKHKLISLTPTQHSMQSLYAFCDYTVWKAWAGGDMEANISKGQVADLAANALMKIANERGFFKPNEKVRGSGAWLDDNRVIVHCGDYAYVDGVKTELHRIKSRYVYVVSAPMPKLEGNPLLSSESVKLREICESLTWDNKLSGLLLAGWLVVAPVCPTLEWRPHIWITGESGSGKSTVLKKIIKTLLSGIAMFYESDTTAPAIRETMQFDGRPIIFDEAEPSPTMDGVLKLARSASSSEQAIAKFGQRGFHAQFCACFSSINPPIKDFADETRISVMVLRKNRKITAQADYDALLDKINEILTPEFSKRLFFRTIANMPTLIENIKIFKKSASKVLKDSRSSDQIAPMLAGLYLLSSTKKVSPEEAMGWIEGKDWTSHTTVDADPDHVRCLRHILTYIMRLQIGQRGIDMSIGDVIEVIFKREDSTGYYESFLKMYGIRVIRRGDLKSHPHLPDGICLVNKSQHISKMLKGTDWAANYTETLKKFDDAIQIKGMRFGAATGVQSAVFIPMSVFWGEEV